MRSDLVGVMIHGWPETALHWQHVLGPLGQVLGRVVTVNPPGLGDGTVVDAYEKATIAESVAADLASRGVDRCVLFGHDWGATIGLLVAASGRVDVRAVVVEEEIPPGVDVDITAPGRDHYPTWHGPFLRSEGLAEDLVPDRTDRLVRRFLMQSAGPRGLDPSVTATYVNAYSSPNAHAATLGYYRTGQADTRDVVDRCRGLSTPCLAVGGEFGMGEAVSAALTDLAIDHEAVVVPGAGHYVAQQAPEDFVRIASDFVRRLPVEN